MNITQLIKKLEAERIKHGELQVEVPDYDSPSYNPVEHVDFNTSPSVITLSTKS